MIDRVSGKGMWESNPWVWVYEFELTDNPNKS
nr:MAG TPA: ASCH domain protein [Caudoviricetes sp.]